MTTPGGPVEIDLQLNASGYVQGAQAAIASTESLTTATAAATRQQTLLQRAVGTVTPFRVVTAALGGSTAAAAAQEQRLSQLAATQAITGQSARALTSTMNNLARSFPIGQRGAEQLVRSLQSVGVTGQGSEKQVALLGKRFSQLAGATGESADAVAMGVVRLQRAFGQRLDDRNITRMNDSVARLSANSGASATGILSFSNAIAPMTRQAGIGAQATLGIATSFSKLGEDGFTAVNAISKVLADMNRSVRDGSSELNTYASIVGKTREEFEQLAKSNPTEALAQVTENLSRPGAQGQRNLERIGLDGVRTQRVLTQLSQQGGIRQEAARATGGRGGESEAGAAAAYGGLNDAAEKAAASAEQLAVALGAPLLGPLTQFTELIGSATGIAAKAAGGSVGMPFADLSKSRFRDLNPLQEGNQLPGGPGLPALLTAAAAGFALVKMGSAAGVARTLGTSQVVRGLAAGYAESRGLRPENSRIARFGMPITNALNEGRLGWQVNRDGSFVTDRNGNPIRNIAGQAAFRGMAFAQGVGEARGTVRGALPPGAMGPAMPPTTLRAQMSALAFTGSQAYNAYSRVGRDLISQGNTADPTFRRSLATYGAGSREQAYAQDARRQFDQMRQTGVGPMTAAMRASTAAIGGWQAEVRAGQGAHGNLRRVVAASVTPFTAAARAASQMAATMSRMAASPIASAAGRGAQAIGSAFLNPAMLAMVGGMVGWQRYQGMQKSRQEFSERTKNMNLEEGLDAYRESMNKAGESSISMAEAMKAAARQVNSSAGSFKEALTIRDVDRQVANTSRGDVVQTYGGDARAVAAQVQAMAGQNVAADEMNAIKVDLLRQFDEAFVGQVLGNIQAPSSRPTDRAAAASSQIPASQAAALASVADPVNLKESVTDRVVAGLPIIGTAASVIRSLPGFQAGDRFNEAEVSKSEQTAISGFMQQTGQRRDASGKRFGADFATQQAYGDINQQFAAAAAEGNENFTAQLSRTLSESLGAGEVNVDAGDLKDANGNFIQALANENEAFAKRLKEELGRGVTINGKGGVSATEILGQVGAGALRADYQLGSAFDNRAAVADRDVNRAIAGSVDRTGSQKAFQRAVDELVESGREAGRSFSDVAVGAYALSRSFDQTTQEFQIASAARAEAAFLAEAQSTFQAPGVGLAGRAERAAGVAAMPLTERSTPEERSEREAARREVVATTQEYGEMLKGRAQQAREFQIQQARTSNDYYRQRAYAQEDFQRQVERSEYDFYLGRARASANFERGEARSIEDFNRGQARSIEDYQRSVARSEEDYQRQRMRSLREFNRQLKRAVEDSAKTLLDPYTRLQTQPVWDTNSLARNMADQLEAVNQQLANLTIARRRGLSQAVIDMLGLSDPNKAQQLARIVADTASDAGLITDLNRQGNQRTAATGRLMGEDVGQRRSREDFARQRVEEEQDYRRGMARQDQDFRRGLARNSSDFRRSLARNREDYNRSMAESLTDFRRAARLQLEEQRRQLGRQNEAYLRSVTRMGEDLKRSQQAFAATFEQLQKATTDAMAGKAVKWEGLMVDSVQSAVDGMKAVIKANEGVFQEFFGITGSAPAPQSRRGIVEGNGGGGTGGFGVMDKGRVTSEYGPRNGRLHAGIDIAAPTGTPVKAYMGGTVAFAGTAGGYGTAVYLDHGDGRVTRYGHLSFLGVQKGKEVKAGQTIALSGNTGRSSGPHLHFEKRLNGTPYDPRRAPFAVGGIVTQPTEALIGEAGSREAVIPLNAQGVDVLAAAMTQFITDAEARMMSTAGARTHITYDSRSYEYDQSVRVEGPITVQSQDPDSMGRALESKARRDNLVGGPRRRS